MKESWLLVLAPISSFPADGDLEKLPAFPADSVAKALELCPLLRRNGLVFESAPVERFRVPSEGVRYLHLDDAEDRLSVARIAEALARGVGPVTVLDEHYLTICEVKAGEPAEKIVAALAARASAGPARNCAECGQRLGARTDRCQTCGWSPLTRRRPSHRPPAFAPGTPPRTSPLPPLRNVLFITLILGLLGVPASLHRGVRGILGCDVAPAPTEVVPPEVANTSGAMTIGRVLLETGSSQLSLEGWIVVAQPPPIGGTAFITQSDGRKVLCDGWGRPIHCSRLRETIRLQSFGVDGKDDHGGGDDLVVTFTLR
jgi:hypothetical protein